MASHRSAPPPLIVVGGSTGAPAALQRFLSALSLPLPACMLIVVHLRAPHDRAIAQRLARLVAPGRSKPKGPGTEFSTAGGENRPLEIPPGLRESALLSPLELARDAEALGAGMIRLAPAGTHLRVEAGTMGDAGTWVTRCQEGAPVHGSCPAVDPLFASAAQAGRERVIAVVLTGMGRDGARGADAIRSQGGQVVVQDEASSVVWGMAGEVVARGLAQAVLDVEDLAPEVEKRVRALESRQNRG